MEKPPGCPQWFKLSAVAFTVTLFIVVILWIRLDPSGFAMLTAKDEVERMNFLTGLMEHLTVVVLMIGIGCGICALFRFRNNIASPLLRYWLLLFVLGSIYFAGEESSWGQWYFGWKTPDPVATVNKQKETNLHNISPWFHQNPRVLVEDFIFIFGFLIPLRHSLGKRITRKGGSNWEYWVAAPPSLAPAGLLVVIIRAAHWLPKPRFAAISSCELREFVIACFLMWYLASYLVRLNLPAEGASSPLERRTQGESAAEPIVE